MSTKTVIANMALGHNKSKTIEDIDGTSKEARVSKQWYEHAKGYLLENHQWGFVEKRVSLALIPSTTVDPADTSIYTYAYAIPGDLLIAEEIYNSTSNKASAKIPFIINTNSTRTAKYIYTDKEDAILIYTANTDSFTLMHSKTFQLALSYVLAWLSAMQLTGDPKLRDDNLNLSFGVSAQSKTNDSNEQSEDLEDFNDYADAMK